MFDKYEDMIDFEDFDKEYEEFSENEFEEVPCGEYEVIVDNLELKETKKKDNLMVVVTYNILEGKYKNQKIWQNQMLTGNKFGKVFVRSLLDNLVDKKVNTRFTNLTELNDVLDDVFDYTGKLEYVLTYGKNKNGYNTYKVEIISD